MHSKVGTRDLEAEEVAEREVLLEAKGFEAEPAAAAGESKAGTREQEAVAPVVEEAV